MALVLYKFDLYAHVSILLNLIRCICSYTYDELSRFNIKLVKHREFNKFVILLYLSYFLLASVSTASAGCWLYSL